MPLAWSSSSHTSLPGLDRQRSTASAWTGRRLGHVAPPDVIRPVVLHADGARPSRALEPAAGRLRLHGRALRLSPARRPSCVAREARAASARADVVFTGGQSLFEAKRRQHPQRPRVPEQRRRRALSHGRAGRSGARGSGGDPAPAPRLLRRHRRAAWTSSCSPASPRRARTGTSCWSARW